jgi:hypothetical protein
MQKILFSLTLIVTMTSLISNGQTAEDSVKATVNNLFTAMKNADTALLKSTFADAAIFQTISKDRTTGKTIIVTDAVQGFIDVIGKQKVGDLDERITFGSVKIDGDLASVWTPYHFYAGGKFSHCGANSFQLVRLNGIWKIQYLIDTRRRQGCNP